MVLIALVVAVAGACSSTGRGASTAQATASGPVRVVAAENFWGSLAAQLGGSAVRVTSVLSDPNADPHSFETNSDDARTFADATYVIVNGAGYDGWAEKLLAGNPRSGRRTLNVADLLGRKAGDNPHFWYSPDDVARVVDRIESDLGALAPGERAYLATQRAAVDAAFAPLRARETAIRSSFGGTPVASTESLFVYLAQDLDLEVISPPEFMSAVAEGNDPSAPSVTTFQDQIVQRRAKVLAFNQQTVTEVTTTMRKLATGAGIPVIPLTETIQPADATFEQWFGRELEAVQRALTTALGR